MAAPSPSPTRSRWPRRIAIAIVALVVLVIAVPFVYFTFIEGDPPPKLSLSDVTTTTGANSPTRGTTAGVPLAGTWTATPDSQAGYRVEEQLFGQHNTAAARTNEVTGTMTIEGTTVTAADLTVDMASITSTDPAGGRRDGQFRGRIMETDRFPTSTFELTKPIELAPVPKDGVEKQYSATGELTLHGTTKTVTIPIKAKRVGDLIAVQGITKITFSDYGIDNPSGGPATVGNTGQLEFLVQFESG